MMDSDVTVSAMIEEVTSSPDTLGPTVSVEVTFRAGSIATNAALTSSSASVVTAASASTAEIRIEATN